jgi:hypothetical protein
MTAGLLSLAQLGRISARVKTCEDDDGTVAQPVVQAIGKTLEQHAPHVSINDRAHVRGRPQSIDGAPNGRQKFAAQPSLCASYQSNAWAMSASA